MLVYDDSPRSEAVIAQIKDALEGTDFINLVALLEARNHQAICTAYEIEKFPTLMLVGDGMEELQRWVYPRLNPLQYSSILHTVNMNRAPALCA